VLGSAEGSAWEPSREWAVASPPQEHPHPFTPTSAPRALGQATCLRFVSLVLDRLERARPDSCTQPGGKHPIGPGLADVDPHPSVGRPPRPTGCPGSVGCRRHEWPRIGPTSPSCPPPCSGESRWGHNMQQRAAVGTKCFDTVAQVLWALMGPPCWAELMLGSAASCVRLLTVPLARHRVLYAVPHAL
jgi:hypothetical protein